jgi:integrase/recombinase XerD
VRSLRVHGKGNKIRYVPLHRAAAGAIALYLEAAGHGADKTAPLFQPVSNNICGAGRAITPDGVYQMLAKYATGAGIEVDGFGPHALRATAAAIAPEHHAILPWSRNGWDARTSRPPVSMTAGICVLKTAQPSR